MSGESSDRMRGGLRRRRVLRRVDAWIGLCVAAFAAFAVATGLTDEFGVAWKGAEFLVFSWPTAVGLALAGLGLVGVGSRTKGGRRWGAASGAVVAGMGLAGLAATCDAALGGEWTRVLSWAWRWTRPEEGMIMSSGAAAGFVLTGAALVLGLSVRSPARAGAMVGTTFAVMLVGAVGIGSWFLGLDLVFGLPRAELMKPLVSGCFVLLSVGLWSMWAASDWYRESRYIRAHHTVRLIGAPLVFVTAIVAGLAGFASQQGALLAMIKKEERLVLNDRVDILEANARRSNQAALAAAKLSGLEAAAGALAGEPGSMRAREAFETSASLALAAGFSSVKLLGADGRVVARAGRAGKEEEVESPRRPGHSSLGWGGEFFLRTRVRAGDGELVLDQDATNMAARVFEGARLGRSGMVKLCVERGSEIVCFPNGRGDKLRLEKSEPERSWESQAVEGGQGVGESTVEEGRVVQVAYASVSPGMGIVVKKSAAEMYSVLRAGFASGAIVILALGLAAATLMNSQMRGLLARVLSSEEKAKESEQEARAVMESVGDAILTLEPDGRIKAANEAAGRLFGYPDLALLGMDVALLVPADRRETLRSKMAQRAERPLEADTLTRRVEGEALKADGSLFPAELSISDARSLGRRVFVWVLRDITERCEVEARLKALAQYDALTALPNRALFMDRLQGALDRMERSHRPIAVLFVDLDGFKQVNDEHGHQAGDQLLGQCAARMLACVRKVDTVARLSGDEFTVLLEGLGPDPMFEAERVAVKILEAAREPYEVSGGGAKVTLCVGIACAEAGVEENIQSLLARADAKMYEAKRSGKNQVRS